MTRFAVPIAEQIWDMKYRMKDAEGKAIDASVEAGGAPAELVCPEGSEDDYQRDLYAECESETARGDATVYTGLDIDGRAWSVILY